MSKRENKDENGKDTQESSERRFSDNGRMHKAG